MASSCEIFSNNWFLMGFSGSWARCWKNFWATPIKEVASWSLKCSVPSKCPSDVKCSVCYVGHRVQRCRLLCSRKMKMYGANQRATRRVESWVGSWGGCGVSRQRVKSQTTWTVANKFVNFWANKAQSRGKRKESFDILTLNRKQKFALCDFCLYANFSLFSIYSGAVVLYYKHITRGSL